jgi:hypothetical protein
MEKTLFAAVALGAVLAFPAGAAGAMANRYGMTQDALLHDPVHGGARCQPGSPVGSNSRSVRTKLITSSLGGWHCWLAQQWAREHSASD